MSAATAQLAAETAGTRLPPRLVMVIAEELGELPGAEPWRSEVLRRAAALQDALPPGDRNTFIAAACTLIGLGEGSTPAGDDYLVGALHALAYASVGAAVPEAAGWYASLATAVSEFASRRTTTASAAWLAAAARGEASSVWRALLEAMASCDERALRLAVRAVRATGHTSGAFSLRGFLDTLVS